MIGRHPVRPPQLGRAFLLITVALTALPAAAAAQSIRGTVVEERTNQPITEVLVTLLSTVGDSIAAQRASQREFLIQAPQSGRYRLRAARLGYATTETAIFEVPRGQDVTLRVTMGVDAVPLEPLQVVTRPRVPLSPQLADFHARRQTGFGKFLTREEIEMRPGATMVELLASMPGVRVTHSAAGVPILNMARASGNLRPPAPPRRQRRGAPPTVEEQFALENNCPVMLIVDGVTIAPKKTRTLDPGAMAMEIDAHRFFFQLSTADIEGIEVYRGIAELPGVFSAPEAQNCGAVAVWLRRR
jgi:hypothetical protein